MGRSAAAGARGCANASWTSLKSEVRSRLWHDAGTNQWLDDQLAGARGWRDESVRRRRRAARSQWKPPDADGPMTSTRDFTDTRTSATQTAPSSNACAPKSPSGADATPRASCATSRFTNSADEVEPLYTALDVDARIGRHARRARHVSVHARHSSDRLSRQAVDDAPVRRLRQRRATRTRASSSCSSTDRRDCRRRSISRR